MVHDTKALMVQDTKALMVQDTKSLMVQDTKALMVQDTKPPYPLLYSLSLSKREVMVVDTVSKQRQ